MYVKMAIEIVHAGLLYIRPAGKCSLNCVLIVKNNTSSYSQVRPCTNADSDAAATSSGKWVASFVGLEWLVINHSSHFDAS